MATAQITTPRPEIVGWNKVGHGDFVCVAATANCDKYWLGAVGFRGGDILALLGPNQNIFDQFSQMIDNEKWKFEILPKGTEILITV